MLPDESDESVAFLNVCTARSTASLYTGWLVGDRTWRTPLFLRNCSNSADINGGPLSDTITFGRPYDANRFLNYLDDWLILAQSEIELIFHRTVLLSHLESLGLMVNWTKNSLLPRQSTSFLGIELDAVAMTARLSTEHARRVRHLAASFQKGSVVPLKTFQRMLGYMALAAAVLQLGLLRMRPLQRWLNARVPHRAWAAGGSRIRVTQSCVSALQPLIAAKWYQLGVTMGDVSYQKVISTTPST